MKTGASAGFNKKKKKKKKKRQDKKALGLRGCGQVIVLLDARVRSVEN